MRPAVRCFLPGLAALTALTLLSSRTSSAQDALPEDRHHVYIVDGMVLRGPTSLVVGKHDHSNIWIESLPKDAILTVTRVEIVVQPTLVGFNPNGAIAPFEALRYRLNLDRDPDTWIYPTSLTSLPAPNPQTLGRAYAVFDFPAGLPLHRRSSLRASGSQLRVSGYLSISVERQIQEATLQAKRFFFDALRRVAPEWVARLAETEARKQIDEYLEKAAKEAGDRIVPPSGDERKAPDGGR